jgi:S1-C subfamily serine protease
MIIYNYEIKTKQGYKMIKINKVLLAGLLLLSTQGISANIETTETQTMLKESISQNGLIKESIVKIFTVASTSSLSRPWASYINQFSGSGCIISGQRILTNAHVVSDATYVEVLKNGEIKRYEAEVLSIDHEADLALITIKEKSFFKNTKSLEIGGLPLLQAEVNVYGFPRGGETLSITKGVVSRIEHQDYVNSGKSLLGIQVDAAINSGNSGGPAISNGKVVGLVMQSMRGAENIGYMIPTSVINHYLEDMKDEKYDGYPLVGVETQNLQSPVMKEMYGLKDKKYGVLINKTIPNSPASRVFKTGDIIISIDGHRVFSNEKVEFRPKEFTNFSYVLDQHQMNDMVDFTILREGKEKKVSVKLDKKNNELFLIKEQIPETKPTYFIYGGLVFVPGVSSHSHDIPSKYHTLYPTKKRDELVLLQRVLSSSLTKGFTGNSLQVIESVNGKKVKNFKEFVSTIEHSKEKFIILEDENHHQMVLNREDVLKSQKSILEKYNIKRAKSDDLKENIKLASVSKKR